jgi:hypothetical protein
VFNNLALLVDTRDGHRGLDKGFRMRLLRQEAYSTPIGALSRTVRLF